MKFMPLCLFGVLICLTVVEATPKSFNHGVDLPTKRPLNIGHRGCAGTLPEHSIEAYRQAVDDGVDVIECDIIVTKDLKLICLHDPWIGDVTDVAEHQEFSDRKTTKYVSEFGTGNVTDWFAMDFTLSELKTLRLKQRYDFRDNSFDGLYAIPTLEEFIQVAKSADRPVGIYPEIKNPVFHKLLSFPPGKRYEDLILDVLTERGYSKKTDPCFIQCFDEDSMMYIVEKTELPLVMLTWVDVPDSTLRRWGNFSYGVGAWKEQLVRFYTDENGYKNKLGQTTNFVEVSHKAGMKVHVYTFRNEDKYLAWDFRQDPYQEYSYFMKLGIEGFFTDFPATFSRYLDDVYKENITCQTGSASHAASGWFIVIISAMYGIVIC